MISVLAEAEVRSVTIPEHLEAHAAVAVRALDALYLGALASLAPGDHERRATVARQWSAARDAVATTLTAVVTA